MAEKPGPIPSPGTWTIVTRLAREKEKPDNGLGQFNPDIKNNPFDSVGALGARAGAGNSPTVTETSLCRPRRPPLLLCHRQQFRFNPWTGYYTACPRPIFSVADWENSTAIRLVVARDILNVCKLDLHSAALPVFLIYIFNARCMSFIYRNIIGIF